MSTQIGIMCAIFANALSLACFHDGQTMAWIRAFDVIDKVFTSVFTLGGWLAHTALTLGSAVSGACALVSVLPYSPRWPRY